VAENQEIVKREAPQTIAVDTSSFASYLDTVKFMQIQRVAAMFAASDMVPVHYRGKTANCALAIHMSTRLDIDPMMFMQNSYVIHGKPGIQSIVAIALVNSRGPFTGPIQWKFAGTIKDKTRQCTAYVTHKVTGQVCESTVTWAMVEAEGWNKKDGSKWLSIPDQMFQYRSASFLAKLYCPEVLLGMVMKDELEDIEAGDKYEPTEKVSSLDEKLNRKKITSVQNSSESITQANPVPAELTPTAGQDSSVRDAELSEIDQFTKPVPPEAQNPSQDDRTEQKPCRYLCNACSNEFDTLAGPKKDLCRKCLSSDILDREKK
jgi:hypothetical protein